MSHRTLIHRLLLFCFSSTGVLSTSVPGQGGAIVDAADALPRGAILRMGSSRLLHGTRLTCVRFSADDSRIGTADADGVVRMWEVATGRLEWEKPKGTGRELSAD